MKFSVYFGAGGAGLAYCQHSGSVPDFFVDNNSELWGSFHNGVIIKSPDCLRDEEINKIIITSGYVKEIIPQLLALGISEEKIVIPAKSLLGLHPFRSRNNREEVAAKLAEVFRCLGENKLVAVGGTALGFCRDQDFIPWDFDIDFFAAKTGQDRIHRAFHDCGLDSVVKSDSSILVSLGLDSGEVVPIGIDFFDTGQEFFLDAYEDYTWKRSVRMFTECDSVIIHGVEFYVPSPCDEYLRSVYGEGWSIPNPEFNYSDYTGER